MSAEVDRLKQRWDRINQRIADAGGDPAAVTVVAVTKGHPVTAMAAAIEAGLSDVGENYAQELLVKSAATDLGGARVHFIGGLQRNKVRRIAPLVALWQTIDRRELMVEVAKRQAGARVLVQINATTEPQKSGCAPDAVADLVAVGSQLGLKVEGLMTVGPTDADADPSAAFSATAQLATNLGLSTISMGMSRDLETAIRCGSTMVRIGTELFGPRPARR